MIFVDTLKSSRVCEKARIFDVAFLSEKGNFW